MDGDMMRYKEVKKGGRGRTESIFILMVEKTRKGISLSDHNFDHKHESQWEGTWTHHKKVEGE